MVRHISEWDNRTSEDQLLFCTTFKEKVYNSNFNGKNGQNELCLNPFACLVRCSLIDPSKAALWRFIAYEPDTLRRSITTLTLSI